jgi:hypothetical protein
MNEIKFGGSLKMKEQKKEEVEQIRQISGKLHPEKDKDLIAAIRKIPKRDRSRTYREALRKYFSGVE